ncbi:MAG: hypothetical protein ACI84O_001420 [Myxococcota bacterium]|jgi:hypothetical protein
MNFLIEMWMPILLSAVFVFIVSSMLHIVFSGWHAPDCKGLKSESDVMRALRESGNGPGEYMMPHAESMAAMKSEAYCAKLEEGPIARITIMSSNAANMTSALSKWFILSICISIVCAYVSSFALVQDGDYLAVFRLTGVVAFCAYSFGYIHNYIWAGTPGKVAIKFVIDGFVYALITAGTFGWLLHA